MTELVEVTGTIIKHTFEDSDVDEVYKIQLRTNNNGYNYINLDSEDGGVVIFPESWPLIRDSINKFLGEWRR